METPEDGKSAEPRGERLKRLSEELLRAEEGARKEELRSELARLAALEACATGPDGVPERDLRAVPCPLGWAKARLTLEAIPSGGLLRLKIGAGLPAENIPSRLAAERFEILERRENPDGTWDLLVQKGKIK